MTLGRAPRQGDLLRSTVGLCEGRVAPDSIYGVLHRECFSLFPDEMFADLFTDVGRRSVPPMIVAVVMVLQRIEGLSDREAVDRFAFDARWKYAAGGLDFDYPSFVHTVLVDMRARLAASAWPDRIFEVTLEAAKAAGLVGRRRVLDSTPLYDAVATMDTVTLVRSAIRGLVKVADAELEGELRGLLCRDDDYVGAGKPVCDWDDKQARQALVDALARDAMALLAALDGREVGPELVRAAALLATVVGQDLDADAEGTFRIARKVAKDRVISTVDPDARHGHKTSARGFDGYKGHVAIDPDTEIITATAATAGNTGDAEAASTLLAEDCPHPPATATRPRQPSRTATTTTAATATATAPTASMARAAARSARTPGARPVRATVGRWGSPAMPPTARESCWPGWRTPARTSRPRCSRRTRRAAGSPKTGSASTWPRARSPAPAGSPCASARPRPAAEPAPSARPAPAARSPRSAPAHRMGAPSPSAATRPSWPEPAPPRPTRPGRPTTRPPGPRWNARSAT
jgi:hypothetical protein